MNIDKNDSSKLNEMISNYLNRVNFELECKNRIPKGMPEWMLQELNKAKKDLVNQGINLDNKRNICTQLDYIFWDIDALLEGTDLRYDDFLRKFSEYAEMLTFVIRNRNNVPGGIPDNILSKVFGYRDVLLGNIYSFEQKNNACTYLENELFDKVEVLLDEAGLDYYESAQSKVRR